VDQAGRAARDGVEARVKIDLKRDDYLHPYPPKPSSKFCLYCGIAWVEDGTGCRECGSIEHYVLDKNKVLRRFLDFPSAFAIARNAELTHDPKCSEAQTGGALLCDCDAVQREYDRIVAKAAA
jgi:hypothetical protein